MDVAAVIPSLLGFLFGALTTATLGAIRFSARLARIEERVDQLGRRFDEAMQGIR